MEQATAWKPWDTTLKSTEPEQESIFVAMNRYRIARLMKKTLV